MVKYVKFGPPDDYVRIWTVLNDLRPSQTVVREIMTGPTEPLFTKATYYKKREGLGSPFQNVSNCLLFKPISYFFGIQIINDKRGQRLPGCLNIYTFLFAETTSDRFLFATFGQVDGYNLPCLMLLVEDPSGCILIIWFSFVSLWNEPAFSLMKKGSGVQNWRKGKTSLCN